MNATNKLNCLNFSKWLLAVGDGTIGEHDNSSRSESKSIPIPSTFLISDSKTALHDLIKFIYDEEFFRNPLITSLSDRAIVCAKNHTADMLNKMILDMYPGETHAYLSDDSMVPHSQNQTDSDIMYPSEYLHLLNFPGIPPHSLCLKEKSPIMLLRNINQSSGLCNGTRLIVSRLMPKLIEAHVLTGTSIGSRVYIPRIDFVHNSKELPQAAMETVNIEDLRETNPELAIEIRVIRRWVTRLVPEETCYIFVDKHADGIHAVAASSYKLNHTTPLALQGCYRISCFSCNDPPTYLKTIDHPVSLRFGSTATITPLEDSVIYPKLYFDFTEYENLIESTPTVDVYTGWFQLTSTPATYTYINPACDQSTRLLQRNQFSPQRSVLSHSVSSSSSIEKRRLSSLLEIDHHQTPANDFPK
ncbi:hypothetical protein SSX86_031487 [Deinandra increscens subsp. villosa]|uniref:DNA helicase Pif1-like 2B domain-containing protein n=1 Tax=Deinandra increscens subsp. villosa TaxID=3103831 RepID=A0AAP0GIN8_9ASTR